MDKPIALLDLDDTLINLKEALYQTLVEEYGKGQALHWSLWEGIDNERNFGLTLDELIALAVKHKIFRKIKPHVFSKVLLMDLQLRGYYVIILTSREGFVPDAYIETRAYLRTHELSFDELIVSPVGENKMDSIKHHEKIHFAIDDQENNCIEFAESGKVEHVFLHALPHNKSCTRFIRLHNLFQVYPHLGLE
jgi:hypothetical protein